MCRVYNRAHGVKDEPTPDDLRQKQRNEIYLADQWARARNRVLEKQKKKQAERNQQRLKKGGKNG